MSNRIDPITIAPGQVATTLDLRRTTALAGCTDVDTHPDGTGRVVLVRRWERLSTGEEILWRVASWLSGQGDLPDQATLDSELDILNAAAVRRVLTAEGVR